MTYKTFQEWKDAGYHVVAGEKSMKRSESGVCLFPEGKSKKIGQFRLKSK